MRVLFFGNNELGCRVLQWLIEDKQEIAALVLHPPQRRRCAERLLEAAARAGVEPLDASRLNESEVHRRIAESRPDIGVSVLFGYRVPAGVLRLPPAGSVNLHPAYLPYNRGAYPNVWSIVDGTPAGVSLHYMDETIDTGPIVAQRALPVEPTDTGATLYARLQEAAFTLFCAAWPLLRDGKVVTTPQAADEGTVHRVRDVEALDRIDLDRNYTARRLIDILRARTFPPYKGAYFVHGGRRIYLRLELTPEEDQQT